MNDDPTATAAERRNRRLREALVFLEPRPAGASKFEILEHVGTAVPPEGEDLELYKSGPVKWESAFLWYTTDMARAGWLLKDGAGHWSITDEGRQALALYPDADDMRAAAGKAYREWYNANKGRPRPWLIRGSSVSGHNLIPTWRADGFVSLPAKHLPDLPEPYAKSELRAAVDEGYSSRTSSYRRSIVTNYDRFLGQMSVGDPVLTTAEGMVHVGRVSGDPVWGEDEALPARLRRDVEWQSPGGGHRVRGPAGTTAQAAGDLRRCRRPPDDSEVIEAWLDGMEQHESDVLPVSPVVEPPQVLGRLKPADSALADDLHLTVGWLDRAIRLLDRRKQVILYGPPGTGKTFIAQALAEHLTDEGNVTLVQFHPSYAYEDFVMGYRPESSGEDAADPATGGGSQGLRFALKNGPLMRIAEQARDNKGVPHILIIDEINRANLAKVFGELYFLLEYRDRAINLLYSEEESEDFYLPENLFLIGTMNTADRSIALVDAAMRRRFAFIELHPDEPPVAGVLPAWVSAWASTRTEFPTDAHHWTPSLLQALNARIADKDFRIGPSYLMREWIYTDPEGLDEVWSTDLLPLLEEHHAGDGTDVTAQYGLAAIRRAVGLLPNASAGQMAETAPGLVDDHVLVSPAGMAHLEGCPHPGEDPDLSQWGRIDTRDAWQQIVAGEVLVTNAGAVVGRPATGACSDCMRRWRAGHAADPIDG